MPDDGGRAAYVVEDDPAVRRSLVLLLRSAGFTVRGFESGEAFLRATAALPFGCVLLDFGMPGLDGLAVQREMAARGVRLPVVVVTVHDDVALAIQMLEAGACDFIEKPYDAETILRAAEAALARGDEGRARARDAEEAASRVAALTPREAEVLRGLVAGRSNQVIAFDLDVSPRTVEVHRANLMAKLGARGLSEAVRIALAAGLGGGTATAEGDGARVGHETLAVRFKSARRGLRAWALGARPKAAAETTAGVGASAKPAVSAATTKPWTGTPRPSTRACTAHHRRARTAPRASARPQPRKLTTPHEHPVEAFRHHIRRYPLPDRTRPPMVDDRDERLGALEQLEAWLRTPMLVLAFIWLVLVVVELVWGGSRLLDVFGTGIWAVFVAEFALRFTLAPEKWPFLRRNWITVLSLLAPALRMIRVLRVFRAARALRGLRLVRIVGTANRGMNALRAGLRRRGVGYVAGLTVLVALLGAGGMLAFEPASQVPGGFAGYGDALWWTAMLLTTMGSQFWPATAEGRILCFLLALYGFAVFGYITATFASYFVGRDASSGEDGEGESGLAALRREITALRAELRGRRF